MSKIEVNYTDYWKETLDVLSDEGALLVSVDENNKPNVMTIGWATLGRIWGKPILTVFVRPSRYTFGLIDKAGDFTVNVLPREMEDIAAFCGKFSGRDCDKFAAQGLIAVPSQYVKSPTIEQAVVSYECLVVHRNNVLQEELTPEIKARAYPQEDYHRIYFGDILGTYASADARERLTR